MSTGEPPSSPRQVAAAIKSGGSLPKIIASGYGHVAADILALAFANGVKVREDADLAEVLAALDLDSEVPLEALHAVCEVLSYVYQANGKAP